MSLISASRFNGTSGSADVALFARLSTAIDGLQLATAPSQTLSKVLIGESISDTQVQQLGSYEGSVAAILASATAGDRNLSDANGVKFSSVLAREDIASTAGVLASNPGAFFARSTVLAAPENEFTINVPATHVPDYMGRRATALQSVKVGESFDTRADRNAVLYSMAVNYSASRQTEFGETLYPTLALPADQVGFGIVVNRLTVNAGWTHDTSGNPVSARKIDLMRAAADSEILQKKKTKVIPYFRPVAAAHFVDTAVVAPFDVQRDGETVRTAPLKMGVKHNLLGLSQSDADLSNGARSQVDSLDPAMGVGAIYVKLGGDVVKFNIEGYPGANFVYDLQNKDRARTLSFNNTILTISSRTKNSAGGALTEAALLAAQSAGLNVKLRTVLSGTANSEFGDVEVFGNRVSISEVLDSDGEPVAATNAVANDLATLFATAEIVGFDPSAWLSNLAMRDNGDFVDRTTFTQRYEVPLLSPVTALQPVSANGATDASDYETLVTTIRFRLRNDVVTAIFDACNRLNDLRENTFTPDDLPSLYGAARFHVLPAYIQKTGADAIDVTKLVGSVDNADLMKNLNAAIVNYIRDLAVTLLIDSEYMAAMDAMGMLDKPTLVIAADPRIHRYLMIDGDIRTATEVFDVKIVNTLDRRFKNKVFFTFGVFDDKRNTEPNILNWGNLIWGSEVVHRAQFPRQGGNRIETIMQPRYRFVEHMPVGALVEFKGIPELFTTRPVLRVDNKVL